MRVLIMPIAMERESLGKFLPVMDPLHISGMAEARDMKFGVFIQGLWP